MPQSHSPKERAEILREHFVRNRPVSEICEEHHIQTEVFRTWENALFENGDLALRQMPPDGLNYSHNYDLAATWLSEAFRGQTLGVLGIETGEIRRVTAFKPTEISVSAGVVDVIFEEVTGKAWHLEEQRNLTNSDLYRFASQHFSVAREWQDRVTDIILASGRNCTKKRKIRTESGIYAPTVIDLTKRDAPKRFKDIREALARGDLSALPELVFLPLYGMERGERQAGFVKELVRFEIGLYKQERLPAQLIAATLIMANRQISESDFQELWEEVKMLKILEFAHKKGREEGIVEGERRGEKRGERRGRIEAARELLIEAIEESLGIVPADIRDRVMTISRPDMLKSLLRQAVRCTTLEEFERMLELATRKPAA